MLEQLGLKNGRTFIIAEIGNNHEGDYNVALELVDAAAEAGVDAVKFQLVKPEYVAGGDRDRYLRYEKFLLSEEEFRNIAEYCSAKGVIFFATPFDFQGATFLNEIQPLFKIASSDNNFVRFIQHVAEFAKPIVISTGLIGIDELSAVIAEIKKFNASAEIALLHCVSSYPVPPEQANLKAIRRLSETFPDLVIGYSDHTIGVDASVASVALGAKIIEKHFTLDHNFSDFRDHQLSADPAEMRLLVARVREMEQMLGSGEKIPQENEVNTLHGFRRSAAAARPLPQGHKITAEDIIWVRPGTGIALHEEPELIGKLTTRPIDYAQPFERAELTD